MNLTALQRKELLRQLEEDGNSAIMDSDQDLKDLVERLHVDCLNRESVQNLWRKLQGKLEQAELDCQALRDMGFSVGTDNGYTSSSSRDRRLSSNGKSLAVCDCGNLNKEIDAAIQPIKDLKRTLSDGISRSQTDIIMSTDLETAKKSMVDFHSLIAKIHKRTRDMVDGTEVRR